MLTTVTLLCYLTSTKELCRSWSHTLWFPSLTWYLKMLSWNPSGKGVQVFWALADLNSLPGTCNKRCTFLRHNLVSVDLLYCTWESRPTFFSSAYLYILLYIVGNGDILLLSYCAVLFFNWVNHESQFLLIEEKRYKFMSYS